MSEPISGGYCIHIHKWTDISRPCPECAETQRESDEQRNELAFQATLLPTRFPNSSELARLKAVEAHMESCRTLLKAPDDEVLYESIKELQSKLAECQAVRTRLADPVVETIK